MYNFTCVKIIFLLLVLISISGAIDLEPWNVPYAVEGTYKINDDSSGLPIAKVKLWIKRDTLYGLVQETYDKNINENPICTQCDGLLKNKPIVGMRFLWGFVEKNDQWVKGKVLDLQNRKIYKADINLSGDENELIVFSYVNFIVKVGRTQKWVKEK